MPTVRERPAVEYDHSLITNDDLFLFNEGSHFALYDKLGAHPMTIDGRRGAFFAVWAPNARHVNVMGDFNGWDKHAHALAAQGQSGIWQGFIPEIVPGDGYKFHIESHQRGYRVDKADPFAFAAENPPKTGSVVADLNYQWNDDAWMAERRSRNSLDAPISIYEMHIGSWRRTADNTRRSLTYRELAEPLADHLNRVGFTHVEFLPVMEHPFYGSWGYQVTGFFAPTSRFGTPQDFMYLIDYLHQRGIGVILDWVPSHFPTDEHGLKFFDGTHLFEHSDERQGMHRDWNTAVFNYGRNEVRSFLISNALFWLDKYHIDGLRVDAVASMLYLDYSRKEGEWIPNEYGGRENLYAVSFLQRFNEEVYRRFPDVQTIAEESTSWPMVSRPTYLGGLGFGMKWDMGWMHDTLEYMKIDPVHRKFHHNKLTFRMLYAFTENFALSLSHDEVVYGKGSLLNKMPGDHWQKFANLRLLLGSMFAQPGKKLLFMGAEFGQWNEWNHEASLDWNLLQYPGHAGAQKWMHDLNNLYTSKPALYGRDMDPSGFEWVDASDADQSCITFLRYGPAGEVMFVACNFTPVPRHNYRVGVPKSGFWREALNSDGKEYGGGGQGNWGGLETAPISSHGRSASLNLTLPPLGIIFMEPA